MRTFTFLGIAAVLAGTACSGSNPPSPHDRESARIARNLATFDDLDYNVFSHQKWDQLKRSHTDDVTVHWPDGHVTHGIERHIADLKAMFVYAPDTRIEQHPIKLGDGEWTAVTGVIEGTFTRPMTMPDGTTIQPTNRAFKLPMATFCHWLPSGKMNEEYLFWDNGAYMKQIGIGK